MGDRKARLAALAAKAGRIKPVASEEPALDEDTVGAAAEESSSSNKRAISFRNYAPNDDSLDPMMEGKSPPKRSKTTKNNKPGASEGQPASSSSALEEALQEARQEASTANNYENEEISTMAPKKINWDLKRNIEDKIAKLERRTQKAIVELLKARLEKEASEEVKGEDSDLD
jgi:coiled-coil domain-containing protein 12